MGTRSVDKTIVSTLDFRPRGVDENLMPLGLGGFVHALWAKTWFAWTEVWTELQMLKGGM